MTGVSYVCNNMNTIAVYNNNRILTVYDVRGSHPVCGRGSFTVCDNRSPFVDPMQFVTLYTNTINGSVIENIRAFFHQDVNVIDQSLYESHRNPVADSYARAGYGTTFLIGNVIAIQVYFFVFVGTIVMEVCVFDQIVRTNDFVNPDGNYQQSCYNAWFFTGIDYNDRNMDVLDVLHAYGYPSMRDLSQNKEFIDRINRRQFSKYYSD